MWEGGGKNLFTVNVSYKKTLGQDRRMIEWFSIDDRWQRSAVCRLTISVSYTWTSAMNNGKVWMWNNDKYVSVALGNGCTSNPRTNMSVHLLSRFSTRHYHNVIAMLLLYADAMTILSTYTLFVHVILSLSRISALTRTRNPTILSDPLNSVENGENQSFIRATDVWKSNDSK